METLEQTYARLQAFVKQTNPSADVGPGSVLSELLLKVCALTHNELINPITRLAEAQSIKKIVETDSTNPEILDQIASNFNISRRTGKKAAGVVRVVVAVSRDYFVQEGFVFQQPTTGLLYRVVSAVSVSPSPVDPSIQQLVPEPGGLYSFTVPVVAQEEGEEYQIGNGTVFNVGPDINFVDFVSASAYGDFSSGASPENNTQLISRLKEGLSAKNLTNEFSISGALKEQFPNLRQVRVVGAGNPALTRNSHNVFGLAVPGYADVYVRNCFGLESRLLAVSPEAINLSTVANAAARLNSQNTREIGDVVFQADNGKHYALVSKSKEAEGCWVELGVSPTALKKLVLPPDLAKGFYEISSARREGLVLQIKAAFYSFERPSTTPTNLVVTDQEARFSKYQQAVVYFEDGSDNNEPVELTLVGQPEIPEIQSVFLQERQRIACADYLVKAAIPCSVSFNLSIFRRPGGEEIDSQNLELDLVNYVNNLAFGESLFVSKIIDICHNYPILRVDLPIRVYGRILAPNGQILTISDTDQLLLPKNPAAGVYPENTAFFTSTDQVTLNVKDS